MKLASVLGQKWGTFDLIVGNPPFRLSEPFIQHLRDHLTEDGVLALILRLNFLAGQERYETLWSRWPPAEVWVLPARPGFSPDGKTDATDYCVMVWRKEAVPTTLSYLDNRAIENRWTPLTFPDPRKVKQVRHEATAPTTDWK